MGATHRRRPPLLCAAIALSLLAGCTTSEAAPQADGEDHAVGAPAAPSSPAAPEEAEVPVPPPTVEPATLRTDDRRRSKRVIAAGGEDAPYNYGPTVLVDRGKYRMWWCSQLGRAKPAGDDILFAASRWLDHGFRGLGRSAATPVFSGSGRGFDAMHTCDPSVLKVGGTYYLYYTGAAGDHDHGNTIGVATSPNGREWTRANGGKPIVRPARDIASGNTYGAGQPSVVYLAGRFYMMFTDTTGRAVGHNGAGQFVLRSTDPTFSRDLEMLSDDGFVPHQQGKARSRSIVDAFSADWMWVDTLAAFAIAHQTADGTSITFWDANFRTNPYEPVLVRGKWREGPGLVRAPDGHAVVSTTDPCGTVAVDLVRATREAPAGPSDLRRFGLDLVDVDACREPDRALLALDGFAMPSPRRTIDLVAGGSLVRIDRRSVADRLAVRVLDEPVRALAEVPVAARIEPGAPVWQAPERGMAFVADDRLWPIGTADPRAVARLNSSPVVDVTAEQWDAHELAANLSGPPS